MTVYNIYYDQWANRLSTVKTDSWISNVAGYNNKKMMKIHLRIAAMRM
jgi:hypothetical protein